MCADCSGMRLAVEDRPQAGNEERAWTCHSSPSLPVRSCGRSRSTMAMSLELASDAADTESAVISTR